MHPANTNTVAIVNANAAAVAIWHVAVEPVPQSARLCGAWVTNNPEVQSLAIAGRLVVVVGEKPPKAVKMLLEMASGRINLGATVGKIMDHTAALDALQARSRTLKGNQRAAITWPIIPGAIDWTFLPPVPNWVVDDPLIAPTIAVSHWLAGLADTWSAIETIRTSRPHLLEGCPSPAPLPFALMP